MIDAHGHQPAEIRYPALCAGTRHQPVALNAQFPVGVPFDVKSEIEIARTAGFLELRGYDLAIAHIHPQAVTAIGRTDDVLRLDTLAEGPLDKTRRHRLLRQVGKESPALPARLRSDSQDHPLLNPYLVRDRPCLPLENDRPEGVLASQSIDVDTSGLLTGNSTGICLRSAILWRAQCNKHRDQGG